MAILDEFPDRREVEPLLQAAVEVGFGYKLFE
jgi:hypothetical protein